MIYEDEHLLVINKPAGLNTHAPSPYAGEGIYDWLRHREPRWAKLAIMHRLDKETSGVMVFAKTNLANRSLIEQFTQRVVRKKYLLLTDRPVRKSEFTVRSALVRAGEKYVSRPISAGSDAAETRFRVAGSRSGETTVEAEPVTGRTHQIRAHAADLGFPVLGDAVYGGTPARRVCLHAAELTFKHPATSRSVTFSAPVAFFEDTRLALRRALIDPGETNAFRLVHGASDGWPGWFVDKLGDFLLSQSERALTARQSKQLVQWLEEHCCRGVYHKLLTRHAQRAGAADVSPQRMFGEGAPEQFVARENGIQFALSFNEGYSAGLFLDQRDNRRRFLTGHVAAAFSPFNSELGTRNSELEILNAFAYTCGFSVCAAKSGARVTSLDLSKKYLDWGKRNFELNSLDPAKHGFIFGDAFDWMRRLAKKKRSFDLVVLDPPTFSRSKDQGFFQVEKDCGKLVSAALPILKPGGVLFASTNAARFAAEKFLEQVTAAIRSARREIVQLHYAPQPPDFPISREEPAYLKTAWLRVA